jgi:hypothetical protein
MDSVGDNINKIFTIAIIDIGMCVGLAYDDVGSETDGFIVGTEKYVRETLERSPRAHKEIYSPNGTEVLP